MKLVLSLCCNKEHSHCIW